MLTGTVVLWQKAAFIITAFLVAVAFYRGIHDVAAMPKWVALGFLVPLVLIKINVRMTALHYWGAALVILSTVSLLWTEIVYDGVYEIWHLLLLAGVFLIAAELDSIEWPLMAFTLGTGVSGIVAILQVFGIFWIETLHNGYASGLFLNQNFMAEACAAAIVIAASRKWWPLVVMNAPGVVFVGARGAILGLMAAAFVWLWQRNRRSSFVLVMLLAVTMAGLTFYKRGDNIGSVNERLAIWADTWDGVTFFGHGIGSFFTQYPVKATRIDVALNRSEYAHNEALNILFELGLPGLVVVSGFVWVLWARAGIDERMVLACLGAIALVGFPLRLPATAFCFALVAGGVCSRWRRHVVSESHGRDYAGQRVQNKDDAYRPGDAHGERRGCFSVQSPDAPKGCTRRDQLHGHHRSIGCLAYN